MFFESVAVPITIIKILDDVADNLKRMHTILHVTIRITL